MSHFDDVLKQANEGMLAKEKEKQASEKRAAEDQARRERELEIKNEGVEHLLKILSEIKADLVSDIPFHFKAAMSDSMGVLKVTVSIGSNPSFRLPYIQFRFDAVDVENDEAVFKIVKEIEDNSLVWMEPDRYRSLDDVTELIKESCASFLNREKYSYHYSFPEYLYKPYRNVSLFFAWLLAAATFITLIVKGGLWGLLLGWIPAVLVFGVVRHLMLLALMIGYVVHLYAEV